MMLENRKFGPVVTPYSRDYRRVKKFDMGLPPRKPKRRLIDPRSYLKLVIVAGLGALIALPLLTDATLAMAKPVTSDTGSCRVLRVVDGDTISMWCAGGGQVRSRLLGFDAPELFSPQCTAEATAAMASKWFLRSQLFGASKLALVREGTDQYDRALVRVFVDGVPLSRTMISAGHARPYEGGQRAGWCM